MSPWLYEFFDSKLHDLPPVFTTHVTHCCSIDFMFICSAVRVDCYHQLHFLSTRLGSILFHLFRKFHHHPSRRALVPHVFPTHFLCQSSMLLACMLMMVLYLYIVPVLMKIGLLDLYNFSTSASLCLQTRFSAHL